MPLTPSAQRIGYSQLRLLRAGIQQSLDSSGSSHDHLDSYIRRTLEDIYDGLRATGGEAVFDGGPEDPQALVEHLLRELKPPELGFVSADAIAVESFDAAYKAVGVKKSPEAAIPISDTSAKRAADVHALLNRAFFPLMVQHHRDVLAHSDEALRALAHEILAKSPAEICEYREAPEPPAAERGRRRVPARHPVTGAAPRFAQAIGSSTHFAIERNALEEGNVVGNGLDTIDGQATHHARIGGVDPEARARLGDQQDRDNLMFTTVGAYGEELAKRMALTARVLVTVALQSPARVATEIAEKNPLLLKYETARARWPFRESIAPGEAPLATLVEGLGTINQMLALLLTDKIPGAETGEEALRALLVEAAGLTTEYTRRVPLGFSGPAALRGAQVRAPVARDPSGGLQLSEKLKALFRSGHDHAIKLTKQQLGTCPMASAFAGKSSAPEAQRSGIQLASEAYWKVFQALRDVPV